MRRLLSSLLFATVLTFAQDHAPAEHGAAGGGHEQAGHEQPHDDGMLKWKWANFALLVLGLGYLIGKMAPPFFAGRNAEIQKGLADAAAMQKESDAKVAAIESRLKNLEGEIAGIREKAAAEMAAEETRVKAEGEAAIAKMRQHSMVEIEAASKQAQSELRQYAAKLALEAAEGQLRARVNQQVDAGLIGGFLKGLNN
jgi:F-type H+-transporting ATPase subunit b